MTDILNNLIIFIEGHKNISYLILFIGAMGESLFPISLFIYGEIFFLSGSILAGYGVLNIFIVAPLLIIGGFLGDNISYYLGNKYGDMILFYIRSHNFLGKFLLEDRYNKVQKFFQEKGGLGILIARFSGPLARIAPFVAGSFKLRYKIFIKYDIVGVILGIGLFIFVGYFFGKNFEWILKIILDYIGILFGLFIFILIIVYYINKYLKNKREGGKNI